MPDPFELVRLHLALECVGVDEQGQLVRIPGDNPDTLFRVYVARHDQGDTLFFRAGLPHATRAKLRRLPVADFFEYPQRVIEILTQDEPCTEQHVGKSYIFPSGFHLDLPAHVVPLSRLDPALVHAYDPALAPFESEVFGVLVDGRIVSTCQSSRENDCAAESWVRTLADYRRRGYARLVTAAWGMHLLARGKIPFYSHKWDNYASQMVAESLGLVQYIADAGYA